MDKQKTQRSLCVTLPIQVTQKLCKKFVLNDFVLHRPVNQRYGFTYWSFHLHLHLCTQNELWNVYFTCNLTVSGTVLVPVTDLL